MGDVADKGRDARAQLFPARPIPRKALPQRLLKVAEGTRTIGVSGTVLLPTRIEIAINPEDIEPFADATDWLRRDIADALRQKALAEGWMVPDGPEVAIVPDPERPVGAPRAVGRIGALQPGDVQTLVRPDPRPAPPPPPGPASESHAPPPPPPGPAPAPDPWPDPKPEDRVDFPTVDESKTNGNGTNGNSGAADAPAEDVGEATQAVDPPTAASPPMPATEVTTAVVHLKLVSMHGDGADLTATLVAGGPDVILGRSSGADLVANDREVSGRHCALRTDQDGVSVIIEDLGSTNGTFVNGQRVDRAALADGTILRTGRSAWRVELEPPKP
jgi:hypothetical protein